MSDGAMEFPILTFFPSVTRESIHDVEEFEWFFDEDSFTMVDPDELKCRFWNAMVVVDAGGRCWRVQRVVDLGVLGAGWRKFWRIVWGACHKVRYELEPGPPMPFEEVLRRVCQSTKDRWWNWRDDEGIAGEAGPPKDEAQMFSESMGRLQQATAISELIAAIDRNAAEANGDLD